MFLPRPLAAWCVFGPMCLTTTRSRKSVCLQLLWSWGDCGRQSGENTKMCQHEILKQLERHLSWAGSFPPLPVAHLLISLQDYEPWARKEREFSAKDPPTNIQRGFHLDPVPILEVITMAETFGWQKLDNDPIILNKKRIKYLTWTILENFRNILT